MLLMSWPGDKNCPGHLTIEGRYVSASDTSRWAWVMGMYHGQRKDWPMTREAVPWTGRHALRG